MHKHFNNIGELKAFLGQQLQKPLVEGADVSISKVGNSYDAVLKVYLRA